MPFDYVEKLAIEDSALMDFVEEAMDWAHTHGVVLRTQEQRNSSQYSQFCPLTLFPSPFPRQLFNEAIGVQKASCELYFKVSWDYNFLIEALTPVTETDDFTRRMVEILTSVHNEGIRQRTVLLLQRADYMAAHMDERHELKQIEVNNLNCLSGFAQPLSQFHRMMLERVGMREEAALRVNTAENHPAKMFAKGILEAWKLFGDSNAVVLMLVAVNHRFRFDFRHLEYDVGALSSGQCKFVLLTLTQCLDRLSLAEDFSLLLDGGKHKIAVVYFRACLSSTCYPTEREWSMRLLIERSTAIKCPSMGLHLANTKKIQQALSKPGVVERYLNAEDAKRVRRTFAGQWGLEKEDDKTEEIVQDAIANPDKYVLKPQTEGGGKNYYAEKVSEKLKSLTPSERAAYILQQKLHPLIVKNYMLHSAEKPELCNVVSELGIFGCLLGRCTKEATNEFLINLNLSEGGHILRTKSEHSHEGGINSGEGVIDSPFLI